MRIDTELSEDISEQVQTLADERGRQKSKTYTDLIENGLQLQQRRETIKQYITDFFEEEKPRHDERLAILKEKYDIGEMHWVETSLQIVYKGNEYSFSSDPSELVTVNGKSYRMNVCPECESEDTNYRFEDRENDDTPNYECKECNAEFDETEQQYRVPEEEADHVKEFSWKRHKLSTYVQSRLTEILQSTMGSRGYRNGEWVGPGIFKYSNSFQTVTIPWFCTDPDRIHFSTSTRMSAYGNIRNPLYPSAKRAFTDDYLQLIREVKAVNGGADRVEPIHIDTRGNKPEIIEVRGLQYEETEVPYRTMGYEVEKVQPSEDDLKSQFDGDDIQIELDHDVDEVTWIKVVNDKRIERPQSYPVETDEYYMAVSTESLNPIHLIDRETQEPVCGEELDGITTDDRRILDEDSMTRRGVCSRCLDEHEDF